MPVYEYQAYNAEGSLTRGIIEASNPKEAKTKLRDQGVLIKDIGMPSTGSSKHQLSGDHLVNFTLQLAQLISAGLPLFEALRSLEEQYRNEKFHRVVLSLGEQVKGGTALSVAMGAFPGSFDRLYCSMVAAGEAAGALEMILERLGRFLEKQQAMKRQIVSSLIYPGLLAVFALCVIALLIGFVIPSIEGIFEGRQLNGFTEFVLASSHFFRDHGFGVFISLAAVIGLASWQLRSEHGKIFLERIGLKTPLVRTLMVHAAIARFARTMGTLQKGGLTLIEALRLARGVMKNRSLEQVVLEAEARVVEGSTLSRQLSRSPYIPPLVWRMLKVGEEAGSTEGIWQRIADIYEGELEKTLGRIMALAQPLILLIMGIVIGGVLLAVLLPLTDLTNLG